MDTVQQNGHKRAVIYCRVSTKGQREEGTSLEKQMEACLAYANRNGLEIVGNRYYDLDKKAAVSEPNEHTFPVPVYADDFTGTVLIEQRPEGSLAYNMLLKGTATVLIVYCIDRLHRPKEEGDEIEVQILVRELKHAGCELHTEDMGKISVSPWDMMKAFLMAYAAGEERRKILARMADGKKRKANDHKKWIGAQYASYGYRKVGKKKDTHLEIDALQSANVLRLFNH